MAKAAFLVDFSIRTRVVVDIPDNLIGQAGDDDATYLRIAEAAKNKLNAYIMEGDSPFLPENIEDISPDIECPYGTMSTDNENAPAPKHKLRVVYGEDACRFRRDHSFEKTVKAIDNGKFDGGVAEYVFDTKRDMSIAEDILSTASGWLDNFWDKNQE